MLSAARSRSCVRTFIIDPYQVAEARAWGADACLLIVAALDDAMLATLHAAVLDYGMTALVEVNNAAELARAVAVGAALIGVNQRDLRNFSVNTDLAADSRRPDARDDRPRRSQRHQERR